MFFSYLKSWCVAGKQKQVKYFSVFQWNLTKNLMLYGELSLILLCLLLHGRQSCTWFDWLGSSCSQRLQRWKLIVAIVQIESYTNKCWSCPWVAINIFFTYVNAWLRLMFCYFDNWKMNIEYWWWVLFIIMIALCDCCIYEGDLRPIWHFTQNNKPQQ